MVLLKAQSQEIIKPLNLQKGSSLGLIDTILDRPFSRKMKAKSTVSLAVIEKNIIKNLFTSNSFF